jgi:hypothetical protein
MSNKKNQDKKLPELTPEQLQAVSGGRGGVNSPRRRGGTAN